LSISNGVNKFFSQAILQLIFLYIHLTNATVVNDAIRFVSSQKSKEKLKSSASNEDGKEEANEPDYDQDRDQLEKAGEMTIHQVF
jgi:hypothetical protein